MLDAYRRWRGAEPHQTVTYWKKIPGLAKKHGVVSHGHFAGEAGTFDARAARKALLLFKKLGMPDAVVLMRDADDQPQRLEGLEQARELFANADRIAVGVAIPEREAWILAGFSPTGDEEQRALARERRRLGFDPSRYPERLRGEGKRSAKQALANLVGDEREREAQCLRSTPISRLRERGSQCGLTRFLDEIEQRIVSTIV